MSRITPLAVASLALTGLTGCFELRGVELDPGDTQDIIPVESGFYTMSLGNPRVTGCGQMDWGSIRELRSMGQMQVGVFLEARQDDLKAAIDGSFRMSGWRDGNRFHLEGGDDVVVSSTDPSEPPPEYDTGMVEPDERGETGAGEPGVPDDTGISDPSPSGDTDGSTEPGGRSTRSHRHGDAPCAERDSRGRPTDCSDLRPVDPDVVFLGQAVRANVIEGSVMVDLDPSYGRCTISYDARVVDEDQGASRRHRGPKPVPATETEERGEMAD
jgi:hypothetical protein